MAAHAAPNLARARSEQRTGASLRSYVPRAMQQHAILPQEPIASAMAREIEMAACPGDTSPPPSSSGCGAVRSLRLRRPDIQGRAADPTTRSISRREVLVSGGTEIGFTQQPLLAPELLLKGMTRWCASIRRRKKLHPLPPTPLETYLRAADPRATTWQMRPRVDTLQPVEIEMGTARQFWITLKVSPEVPRGA